MKKVLFIGAHTDDIELGAGGTIAKLTREGVDVHCMVFSACGNAALPGEYENSMNMLNVSVFAIGLLQHRIFPETRQRILDEILQCRKFSYDTIFTHSLSDCHQDHKVVAEESIRAFRSANIYAYSHPWNTIHVNHTCISEFQEDDLNKKIDALAAYKSQLERPYMNPEYIKALAVSTGIMGGVKYAESFEVIRQKI